MDHITSKEMTAVIRAAAIWTGEDILEIKAEEVGAHSIRVGASMPMYLGKCPVYTIMMTGRWSSNAFCFISENKWNNSATTYPSGCSGLNYSDTCQIWHLE